MINENIAAISTSLSASGVAVIRISGDSPLSVAQKMFTPAGKTAVENFIPNMMYVGEIHADGFNDFGLCVYFKAPKSFTGEDVVEFHCHGGIAITKGVLKSALKNGARLAENGEFTKRAFMNGKLSLSGAEGLIDMINGESESQARAGYYLYREKLTAEIERLQNLLTATLSEIDADMDFPEEDLEVESRKTASENLVVALDGVNKLIDSYKTGRTLKNGVKVGIVGKPNTGKSSLLNALLNYEKAIVSDQAGTTRDIVEGSIDINGVRFYFSDTAGIRESEGVEAIGVGLSKKVASESDLILFVTDFNSFSSEDKEIYNSIKDKNIIAVQNKVDVCDNKLDIADITVSAKVGDNLEKLKGLIFDKTVGSGMDLNGDFLCEERHYNALLRAKERLNSAILSVNDTSLDLLAIDVTDAWSALGEITGKTATEEIINDIFSRFCVGK